MKGVRTAIGAVTAGLGLLPEKAEAHLVATGLGPMYDGCAHFGSSPEDLLPVIALGLFAGLRGARHARVLVSTLTPAWFAGGLAALLGLLLPAGSAPAATAGLFLMIGAMLAANADLAPGPGAVVAAALGLVRGCAELDGGTNSFPHLLILLGMTGSAFTLFSLSASLTLPLNRSGLSVVARVGGSWLAALGLLLAGWTLHYGAHVP